MNSIISKLQSTYQALDRTTVTSDLLDNLYSEDVYFADPLHEIQSLAELRKYFEGMYKNVIDIRFEFIDTLENENTAFLTWVMTFTHPKLNSAQPIDVKGTTHIQHNGEKITSHRDYFDSTHMIFDHIPLVKNIISVVKQRIK